jgi:hypothetical protein
MTMIMVMAKKLNKSINKPITNKANKKNRPEPISEVDGTEKRCNSNNNESNKKPNKNTKNESSHISLLRSLVPRMGAGRFERPTLRVFQLSPISFVHRSRVNERYQ